MTREDLIKKWLDNRLNSEELEAFKQLEDYNELIRLDTALQQFKPQAFESDAELEKLQFALKSKTKKQNQWLKPVLRIAAILAIAFSAYFYTTTLDTTINTAIAQKETIHLPDDSQVVLNAETALVFNTKNWSKNRVLDLDGEAYFKVAKGSTFSVHTSAGTISVLGTAFNVKNRDNLFEVVCFEGRVQVEHNNTKTVLKPGERFLLLEHTLIDSPIINNSTPFWLSNETAFTSMPFSQVIAEFERQYNVTFNVSTIDTNQLFTGGFPHDNIEVALQNITSPLQLNYTQNDTKISLKRE